MLFALDYALSVLERVKVINHYNRLASVDYCGVKWLRERMLELPEGYIYVCNASLLPQQLPNHIGLMTVNDCNRDFSGCTIDVVELSPDTCLPELSEELEQHIFFHAAKYQLAEDLLSAWIYGMSIKQIIDFCYRFLGNPIIITSENSKLVSYASDCDVTDPVFSDILTNGASSKYFRELFDQYGLRQQLEDTPAPFLLDDGLFKDQRRIACKITTGSNMTGIFVLLENNRKFVFSDYVYVNIICRLISRQTDSFCFPNSFGGFLLEQNMIDIINEKFNILNGGDEWLEPVNGDKYSNFQIAVIDDSHLNMHRSMELRREIEYRLYFCRTLKYDSDTVILCNPKDKNETLLMRQVFENFIKTHGFTVGLSAPFAVIRDAGIYYRQARKVLDISLQIGRNQRVNDFFDMSVYILLNQVMQISDIKEYYNRLPDKIIQHDMNAGTEYFVTLLAYMGFGGNKKHVSEALHIHRNTLSYRLEKIEGLLDHSLDDGEFLFNMHFSTKVKEIMDTKAAYGQRDVTIQTPPLLST